jgi:hypothetical protein
MKKILFPFLGIFTSCLPAEKSNKAIHLNEETKQELLTLELKWLEAEFKLDTTYISTLIDSTFAGISGSRITNKQQELEGMFHTINAMRKDGRVNLYENVAVVTFIVHTYKKDKGLPIEKRTRFYDVWVNRNGKWKAVAAQGTVVE